METSERMALGPDSMGDKAADMPWPMIREDIYTVATGYGTHEIEYTYRSIWECREDQPIVMLTGYRHIGNPLAHVGATQDIQFQIGDNLIDEWRDIAIGSEDSREDI